MTKEIDGTQEAFEAQAAFARAMGHPVRMSILHVLHDAGHPVASQHLLAHLQIPKGSLSQHLSRMTAAGVLRASRRGRQLYVEMAHPDIGVACDLVRRCLARQARDQAKSLTED